MDKVMAFSSMSLNGFGAKKLTQLMFFIESIDLLNGLDMLFSLERCHGPFLPINFFTGNFGYIPIIDINEEILIMVLNVFFVDDFWNLRDPSGSRAY
jgi:hypothetical protein